MLTLPTLCITGKLEYAQRIRLLKLYVNIRLWWNEWQHKDYDKTGTSTVYICYYNETESDLLFHYLNQQNTIKSDRVSHYALRLNKTVGEINRILTFHHEDNSTIKRLLLTK